MLGLADPLGHFPDPVNMPPVMAGAVAGEDGLDVACRAVNEVGHHGCGALNLEAHTNSIR